MVPGIQKHVFYKNYVEHLTFLGAFALFSAFSIFFQTWHFLELAGHWPANSNNFVLRKKFEKTQNSIFFVFFGPTSYKNSKYTYFPVRNQLILSGKQLKIHFFEAFFARFRYLKKGCSPDWYQITTQTSKQAFTPVLRP